MRRLPLLAAFASIVFRLREFLPAGTLPSRGSPELSFQGSDLTPQFAVFARAAIRSLWQEGCLPFWNPLVNGGSPLLEMPTAGPFGLATWLGAFVRPEAAVKWSMVLHVLLGMAGTSALAREIGVSSPLAAVSALAFALSPFLLDHFRVGHLCIVYPLAAMPWVFFCIARSMRADRHAHRWALAAGGCLAVQVLEGGDSPLLYQALALPLLAVPVLLGDSRGLDSRRLLATGLVVLVSAVSLSALQLFPVLHYMALSNRGGAGGLTLADSIADFPEVLHPLPGAEFLVLVLIGCVWTLFRRERKTGMWLALVLAVSLAAAFSTSFYGLLWLWFPGFRFQRIPQRALVLAAVAGPPLVGAGLEGLRTLLGRFVAPRFAAAGTALAAATVVVSLWLDAPGLPPMTSTETETASNHALQWIRTHDVDDSRVHVFESNTRHWSIDHATSALGLPALVSYTPSEHGDYLASDFAPSARSFIAESYSSPSKFWGLMGVRYVLSTRRREIDGFRLAAEVPRCPVEICQPSKSAGPFVYENEQVLPHAWLVDHAIAIVGPPRRAFEASLNLMRRGDFDPRLTVVVQAEAGREPASVDLVVSTEPGSTSPPYAFGVEGQRRLREVLSASAARAPGPGVDTVRIDSNRLSLRSPAGGWLVVSERLGLYPGWSAEVAGSEQAIVRANAVLGALHLTGPGHVDLAYRAPGFDAGLCALFGGLLLAVAFEAALARWPGARAGNPAGVGRSLERISRTRSRPGGKNRPARDQCVN